MTDRRLETLRALAALKARRALADLARAREAAAAAEAEARAAERLAREEAHGAPVVGLDLRASERRRAVLLSRAASARFDSVRLGEAARPVEAAAREAAAREEGAAGLAREAAERRRKADAAKAERGLSVLTTLPRPKL